MDSGSDPAVRPLGDLARLVDFRTERRPSHYSLTRPELIGLLLAETAAAVTLCPVYGERV